jgi:putative transposase
MDEPYLFNAVRYVLQNPIKAGLVSDICEWPHSSARAHVSGYSDGVVATGPLQDKISDWRGYLGLPVGEEVTDRFVAHAATGRPMGDVEFVRRLEETTGRALLPKRRGPKPKSRAPGA